MKAPAKEQRKAYIRMAKNHAPEMNRASRRADAHAMHKDPSRDPRNQQTLERFKATYDRKMRSEIGIYCVSTIADDILMWSHYANSHYGICLEFDCNVPSFRNALEVSYAVERPCLNLYTDSQNPALDKSMLTKAAHWSYEKEWRLISYQSGPGLKSIENSALTRIILGANATVSTEKLIREWSAARAQPVRLSKAVIDGRRFALCIKDL